MLISERNSGLLARTNMQIFLITSTEEHLALPAEVSH
jgi:hypothetical protein